MRLIDTHQHLIFRDRFGYGWTDGIPALAAGDFKIADHRQPSEGRIEAAVFMETGVDDEDYMAESRFVAGIAADQGIAGIVASCRPEFASGFEPWLEEGADLGFNGFRRILHDAPDEISRSSVFRGNVRRIGARGMSFGLCVLARQLPVAMELVSACPDTVFILDHCGVPDIAGGGFDPWRKSLSEISERSNIFCKLSGLTAYAGNPSDFGAAIRPYVDHVLETFGPSRLVWGSDWPVVNLGAGLCGWLDLTESILGGLSSDEADQIGHLNARRVYRLPETVRKHAAAGIQ
jgi:predicted TIM-barrel fold metal-dependent hydrolase